MVDINVLENWISAVKRRLPEMQKRLRAMHDCTATHTKFAEEVAVLEKIVAEHDALSIEQLSSPELLRIFDSLFQGASQCAQLALDTNDEEHLVVCLPALQNLDERLRSLRANT